MHYLERSTYVSLALLSLALLAGFFVPGVTRAAESCGSIIAPDGWENSFVEPGPISSVPILDCLDPFEVTIDPPNPYTLSIGGVAVTGDTLSVPGETFSGITYTGEPAQTGVNLYAFRHENGNLVYTPIYPAPIGTNDYLAFAETYFTDPTIRGQYMAIVMVEERDAYFYDVNGEPLLDTDGEVVVNRFYNFMDAAEQAFVPKPPELPVGTYTFVWREYMLFNTYRSIFDEMWSIFAPTAYAFTGIPPNVYTKTVTVTTAPETPAGASSVLFLPGIQASRLYTKGLLGSEDELWIPNWNQDVRQLAMTADGNSVNDVYTRDILDRIAGLGTVYASFGSSLDTLVDEKIIYEWQPYAYDWRYAVDDIAQDGTKYEDEMRSLLVLFDKLAKDSYSKKVTIIAHSNGGLLAKALMTELEKHGKEVLVDKVIFLASPQLGTPKAIGSMLHGFDQAALGGLIIDAAVARSVIQNMPGPYSLLPTNTYLESVQKPIVTFESGSALDSFRNAYGNTIDSYAELEQFLLGNEGRQSAQTVYDAISVNQNLYEKSEVLHDTVLNDWRAPDGVQVVEVVGVGLQTVSGFTYREFSQRSCSTDLFTEVCEVKKYYKPVPIFSLYGDETVMAQSAKGYRGEKETYYFDLYKQSQIEDFKHVNFTEADSIQALVRHYIKNEPVGQIPFLSKTAVVQDQPETLLLSVNSPAYVVVKNRSGEVIKINFLPDGLMEKVEEIPGSAIFYLGSTTYITLPIDEYTIDVVGTGVGGVTIVIDTLAEESLTTTYRVTVPDTQAGMKISTILDSGELAPLSVDVTGDGAVDYQLNPVTGERIEEGVVSQPVRTSSRTGTKVKATMPRGEVAGIGTTSQEELLQIYYQQLYVLLQQLSLLLVKYEN